MRGVTVLLVCIAMALLAGCGSDDSAQRPMTSTLAQDQEAASPTAVDTHSIETALVRCDVLFLTTALSDLLSQPNREEVLTHLKEKWLAEDESDPTYRCLHDPLVRAHSGNVLAQAHANRMIEGVPIERVLGALRAGLDSSEPEIVQVSVMGLGDYLNEQDVKRFQDIIEGDSLPNARVAIGALAGSCLPSAQNALAHIQRSAAEPLGKEAAEIRARVAPRHELKCKSSTQR